MKSAIAPMMVAILIVSILGLLEGHLQPKDDSLSEERVVTPRAILILPEQEAKLTKCTEEGKGYTLTIRGPKLTVIQVQCD